MDEVHRARFLPNAVVALAEPRDQEATEAVALLRDRPQVGATHRLRVRTVHLSFACHDARGTRGATEEDLIMWQASSKAPARATKWIRRRIRTSHRSIGESGLVRGRRVQQVPPVNDVLRCHPFTELGGDRVPSSSHAVHTTTQWASVTAS